MNPGATDPITVNIDFALEGVSAVVDFSGVPEAAPCARIFARMDVDGAPVFLGEAVVERGGTVRLGGMNGLGGQGNPQGFGLADFTAVMVDTSIFGPTDGRATQVSHTHQLPTSVGSEYEVAVTLVTDAFVGLGLENEVINDHFDTLGLRFEALDQGGNPLPNIRFLAVPPLPPTTFTLPPLVVADALAEKALNNPFNAFSETDSDSTAWNLTSEAFARAEAGSIPAGSGQGATGAVAEAELPAQGEFGFREVRVHARAAASGPPDQGGSPDEGGHARASGGYRLNIVPEYTGTGSSPALIPIDLDVALTGELGAFLVPDSCGNCGPANAPAPEDMTARVDVEVFVHLGTERNRVFFAYASLDRFSPTSGGDSAVRISGPWKNESGFTVGPASLAIDHRKLYLDQALVPFGPFGVELVVTADARSDFTTTRYTRVDTYADFFDTGSLGVGTSAADVTLRLEVPEPAGALGQAVALIVLGSLRRRGPAGT